MQKLRLIFLLAALTPIQYLYAQADFSRYVNPFIGTGGHGHTYPGATMPHGMVQLSPDTRLDGWDGCGGYHYSDSFLYGFSHTHLSGTGVSDYGDILLMPVNGKPSPDNKVYGSSFSHASELASPGFYAVTLDDDNIRVECTVTDRVGFHHYTYSKRSEAGIILDLKHRDEVIASSLKMEDSVTVTGMRLSKAWAEKQYVFFVIKLSRPMSRFGIWDDDKLLGPDNKELDQSKNLKAFFQFNLSDHDDVFVKVAISPVSIEGAKKNLSAELPGWDFADTKSRAEHIWNDELSKISVRDTDTSRLSVFYTALYHSMVVPNIYMDIDRKYRGRDNEIHIADGFDYYSVFSLWDTYRAAHPLYTIIDQKRTLDYIKTFLAQYRQGGRLPVWELASNETDCMIGYHSIPVIVDAYMKGIRDFDTKLALEAMKKSATWNHLGLPAYMRNGVISIEDEHESVSKVLEYAYDDWCIAIFAKETGNMEDYHTYIKRAQYYKNIYDSKTGFMRPRKNGGWLSPFDPREVNNHFTEANSWQYSFYVPQDIQGFIKLSGGSAKLEQKLDQLFSAPEETTGRNQSDITGLIGQYAHGNEPSHHIAYLYNFTGQPWKTQEKVRQVMETMYANTPDGLIGNEDCGQMSAWYVMSALGFYPVTPGSSQYAIGSPLFNMAEIQLENGRTFVINAPGADKANRYVQKVFLSTTSSLRPKEWPNAYLVHADIAEGGLVSVMMGDKPSVFLLNPPTSVINDSSGRSMIVINPVIDGGPISFKEKKQVKIYAPQKGTSIFYTKDGSEPTKKSLRYKSPFFIDASTTIKAIAMNKKGLMSHTSTAVYNKMQHNWSVTLNTAYEQQYDGGGAEGLIDHIYGTTNWRMGNWQGYQKTDVDIIVDLKEAMQVSKVSVRFLQDTRSWIVMPKEVVISYSEDAVNFTNVFSGGNFLPVDNLEPQIKEVVAENSIITARYIRIKAKQFGQLPQWHEGAGGDTHIFLDEISIR